MEVLCQLSYNGKNLGNDKAKRMEKEQNPQYRFDFNYTIKKRIKKQPKRSGLFFFEYMLN